MARPGYMSIYADERTQGIFDEFFAKNPVQSAQNGKGCHNGNEYFMWRHGPPPFDPKWPQWPYPPGTPGSRAGR